MPINLEQVRKGFIYQNKAPIGAILQDVQTLATADEHYARGRRKRFWLGMMGVGAFILGLVLAIAEVLTPLAVLLIFCGIPAAIVFFIMAATYGGKLKKYRHRYELLRDMCATLARDTSPNAPVFVNLALQDTSRFLREEEYPQRRKGKQSFHEDNGLCLTGELLDGNQYSLALRELTRKRSFITPRGKHKTKFRTSYFLSLRMICPKDLYGDLRAIENGLRRNVRLPQSCVLKSLKAGRKMLFMQVRLANVAEARGAAVMMFLALYRGLNLARRLHGPSSKGKGAA
jgi:hypothetical protein